MGSNLRAEQRGIVYASLAAAIFCGLVLAGGYALLPLHFQFPTELPERLAFAIQADLFVLIWIAVGVRMVSRGRFHSAADIGGSAAGPPSPKLAIPVAFLQNTLEQALLAVGAHFALATLLSGSTLSILVAAVVLFGIGRVTFLLGYAKGASGRAFGMATTVIPTTLGYALAIGLLMVK